MLDLPFGPEHEQDFSRSNDSGCKGDVKPASGENSSVSPLRFGNLRFLSWERGAVNGLPPNMWKTPVKKLGTTRRSPVRRKLLRIALSFVQPAFKPMV